jgi:hypothetical protein
MNILLSEELGSKLLEMARVREAPVEDIIRVALQSLTGSIVLYALDDKIGFGKYAQETVETIIRCDPRYILWAITNTERFRLGRAAMALFEEITGTVA